MSAQKLPPRQKMINMLYLVLTAILALNVSNEVLDAFKAVNDGMSVSNATLQSKNSQTFANLEDQYRNDPARVDSVLRKAKVAHELSLKLHKQLENYKTVIVEEAGGIDTETGKIKRDDNVDIATRIFVEDNGKRGKELKREIEETRSQLLALLNSEEKKNAEKAIALHTQRQDENVSWEFATFNHVPVVAAVTLLSKFQNDLLSAEGYVVDKLYNSIYQRIEKVDRFAARVIAPSSYVLQGEQYQADVMVAAYNTSQNPDVFLGAFSSEVEKSSTGDWLPIESSSADPPLLNPTKVDVKEGLGKLNFNGTASGNKSYTGVVRIKSNAGDGYKFYPFEGTYEVAVKTTVISPLMMNVLYVGLDNPVNISVPGVSQSDVVPVIVGNGILRKNVDDSYYAEVHSPGEVTIKVNAKIDGRLVKMGEQRFRVKRVPDPLTTVDGLPQNSRVTAQFFKSRRGVVAKSDDFIYGSLPWKVQSFTVYVLRGSDVIPVSNTGPLFSEKALSLFKNLRKGDSVFIDNIMVKGPDKKVRKIAPIAFNIID